MVDAKKKIFPNFLFLQPSLGLTSLVCLDGWLMDVVVSSSHLKK